MKLTGFSLVVLLLFLTGTVTGQENGTATDDQEFIQSLVVADHSLIKVITVLMASDQVLSCDLDMTLLGSSYRQFHDLSEKYIDREEGHMDQFVEATQILVSSEEFRAHVMNSKSCEDLLSIYGDVLRQVARSSQRISELSEP